MGLKAFKGGIHPFEGKKPTEDVKIIDVLPKSELTFPMSQHIGNDAVPVVEKGQRVLAGQKIGEAQGLISADVLASVSGTVIAVENRLTVSGNHILSVVVENDEKYEKLPDIGKKRDYKKLTSDEIRQIIKEAAIVGLGGAGFPTHVKLTPKDDEKIEHIIINACECEPYLTSDYRIMIEQGEKVVGGLEIILKLFKNSKGIIAAEDNKPDAISNLKKIIGDNERIKVVDLNTRYPQGGERVLVYAVTGKKINSDMIPSDAGAIVINSSTAASIYDAVVNSQPLMTAVVTLAGDGIKNPGNYRVPVGTSYSDIIEAAGGFSENKPKKIIAGGPMMGISLFSLDVPVTKTANGLLAFSKDEVAEYECSNCIHCGRCAQVCPGRILPMKMMSAARKNDLDGFIRLNGMECCECGCCTYVCPAKLGLTQAFKQMKKWARDSETK